MTREEYVGLVAVKRLSAVEVETSRSNQREFHADRLRSALGFPSGGASGQLTAIVYGEDGVAPAVEEATYTLYQARKPPRSEYKLYPKTRIFMENARAGDLLLVFRQEGSDTLMVIVARTGTRAEQELLDALFAGNGRALQAFQVVRPPEPPDTPAAEIADALAEPAPAPVEAAFQVADHPLYADALASRRYPTTARIAEAAAEIVIDAGGAADADELLQALLDAETSLFFAIEHQLASAELRALLDSSHELTVVLEFAMSRHQSRKVRRGASLQNHFGYVLERERIPHTTQCTPESPPPADFMVPSCDAYHDPDYPPEKLRIVSCKSTTRERWYETIPESQRIGVKYLLTLDDGMSDQKIADMWSANVRPFMPRGTIETAYAGRSSAERLSTVTQLVAELRAVLPEPT